MQEKRKQGGSSVTRKNTGSTSGRFFGWERLYNTRKSFQGIAFPSRDMVKRTELFSQLTSHSTKKLKGPTPLKGTLKDRDSIQVPPERQLQIKSLWQILSWKKGSQQVPGEDGFCDPSFEKKKGNHICKYECSKVFTVVTLKNKHVRDHVRTALTVYFRLAISVLLNCF